MILICCHNIKHIFFRLKLNSIYDNVLLLDPGEKRRKASIYKEMSTQIYPMMLRKSNRMHYATVTNGDHVILKAPNSQVTLEVTNGVKTAVLHYIYPDYKDIKSALPRHECIISPIVHFSVEDSGENSSHFPFKFKARLPHCLQTDSDFAFVKVRCGNIFEQSSLKEVPKGETESSTIPCYNIDGQYITLYTNCFCDVVCSSEEKICHKSLVILPFGSLSPDEENCQTYVKLKLFICSYLYNMKDYYLVSFVLPFMLLTHTDMETCPA